MRITSHCSAWARNAWAGMASATICYAEYMGLGAVIGPALLGYGDQSKSVGTLLVLLAASLSCVIWCFRNAAILAGPRGASLSVLALVLMWLQAHFSITAAQQLPMLGAVMLGVAAALWLSSASRWQSLLDALPTWLVPSFLYASAIGIAASAVSKYLYSCLQLSAWQTWGIYLVATLVGVLMPMVCRHAAQRYMATAPAIAKAFSALQGMSMMLAAGVAWWGYSLSSLHTSAGGRCARLGTVELELHTLTERMYTLTQASHWTSLLGPLLCALIAGLAVGIVVVIESRTAMQTLEGLVSAKNPSDTMPIPSKPAALRTLGKMHLLLGGLTTAPVSISQSRTQLLWTFGGRSPNAALLHGVSLLLIAWVASPWLAWLPQLSLAVLMTLIAIQMVSPHVIAIWRKAYDPHIAPALGLRAGLGLWLAIAITALTGQVLMAFLIPAIVFGFFRLWRSQRIQSRKSKRALSQ